MKHLKSILTALILAIAVAGVAEYAMAQKKQAGFCTQCGARVRGRTICKDCETKNKKAAEKKEAERKAAQKREAERKEAEKREAERKAAQKREAERKEAERREAERKAAEKRETERKEAAKREAERKNAEKREAERKEAERKAAEKREAERKEAERQYVDLGLPSGTLWATMNVGASIPEGLGYYFAWGETTPKQKYDWSNYNWCNGSGNRITKYCTKSDYGKVDNKTELDLADDAAYVNWGPQWRMPSREQLKELRKECDWQWTNRNGANGYLVTSKRNGASLFLPATGIMNEGMLGSLGKSGDYWSRTLDVRYHGAYALFFDSDNVELLSEYRYDGQNVRAVRVSQKAEQERKEAEKQEAERKKAEAERRSMTPQYFTVNGVSFTMVAVPGGTFTMGATSEQGSDAFSDEEPTHSVTLSSYYIGQTEVTHELWEAVMGENPSLFVGAKRPVEQVSWNDCQEFIRKLNDKTGMHFRLPTEAEWEYAARGGKSGGTKYAGSNNIDDVAWFGDNSDGKTHEVATRQANDLGIYDMSGNVWEWCNDWYGSYSSSSQTNPKGPSTGFDHVIRGGGYNLSATYCRVSIRRKHSTDLCIDYIGFRLAL